ncbi:MAG: mevalonate kinase [Sandaracinaceae bacterium]
MNEIVLSAPGKMMIAGEYAVLDGAEALVASVDKRLFAYARSPHSSSGSPTPSVDSADPPSLPPEALLTRQHAEAELGPVPEMSLRIDASALRRGDRKLGLGSSSAASAAAASAVLAWHGEDPSTRRRDVLKWALAGHRAVAPEGSGADVAAATLGGVVRFTRAAAEEATAIAWPEGLLVEVVWTGSPARTSDLVRKVKALETSEPLRYQRAMGRLSQAAARMISGFDTLNAASVVEAAEEHGLAMENLGNAAGAPIVEASLARTANLAREHGGASKPSGAGGGDVALAFFATEDRRKAFVDACPEAGLTLLSMEVGADGVRRDN